MNDKCFQYIVNFYFILIFYHGFMIYIYRESSLVL